MRKSKLRKVYRSKMMALAPRARTRKSIEIKKRFFDEFDLPEIQVLHFYQPISGKNEVESKRIIEKIWREYPHIKTLSSRIDFSTGSLEHLEVNPDSRLETNHWGIPEPVGNRPANETTIDLVLVPLLCFDKSGNRIGYGKGYYDQFLSKCRNDCTKIGLSFFEPVEEIEDVESHDVALDFCITPNRVIEFKK